MVDHGCPSSWLREVDHDHGWLWLIKGYYGWTCPWLTFVHHADLIMVGHVDYVHCSLLWHYCIAMLIIFCSSNYNINFCSSHANISFCSSHCVISFCSSHVDIRFFSSHGDINLLFVTWHRKVMVIKLRQRFMLFTIWHWNRFVIIR